MKIYTRTGDAGETGLFGGARVGKDDPRVEAYGTVDELNSCLGVVRTLRASAETDESLLQIQSDLFTLGAELACLPGKEEKLRMTMLSEADIARLEAWIDRAEAPLEPLENFVLPGGCTSAAELHRARTVCRRAERRVCELSEQGLLQLPRCIVYLNRLSDLLWLMARCSEQRPLPGEQVLKV